MKLSTTSPAASPRRAPACRGALARAASLAAVVGLAACGELTAAARAQEPAAAASAAAADAAKPAEAAPQTDAEGAREMLALLGMGDDRLAAFVDGREIGEGETDLLRRMLYAVWRLKPEELHRWVHEQIPWEHFAGDSTPWRGEVFQLRGAVTRVTRVEAPPEVAALFIHPDGERTLSHFYRCEVELGEFGNAATVYAIDVPREWALDKPLAERIGGMACLVKFADSAPPCRPVFAVQRLEWYAPSVLGDLEMDYGLFDAVENSRPLSMADRDAFYSLLAAAGRAGAYELLRRVGKPSPVLPLFRTKDPKTGESRPLTAKPGELFWIYGAARRAVLIRIADPEVIALYGFDHYYEMEIFTQDSQSNPITVCVRDLPEGMPVGPNINVDVHVGAFFLKTWTYRQQMLVTEGEPLPERTPLQVTPLLIGRAPIVVVREESDDWVSWLACGLFLAGLTGLSAGVWWMERGNRRFHKRAISHKYDPSPASQFDELAEQDQGPVRFENEST